MSTVIGGTVRGAGRAVAAVALLLCLVTVLSSCSARRPALPKPPVTAAAKIAPLGFTIQAGAFSNVDNAAGLTEQLNVHNLNAYYFVYEEGLYKVRFGDFATREEALRKACELQSEGVIEEYYIVRPDQYSLAQRSLRGDQYVRNRLVETARSFLGVPYKWGGESETEGFDCSGLAMSVYRLNGFSLPRTSRDQFRTGAPVDVRNLSEGDLVFFDTRGRGAVSHVGIYTGGGRFIHAPRSGRDVSIDSLDNSWYRSRYLGARSYL